MGGRSTSFFITSSWLAVITATPALAADLYTPPEVDWAPQSHGVVDLPAVSGINGKLLVYGGGIDGDGVVHGEGVISVPVSHSYGLQIEGGVGSRDGNTIGDIGGHLFWRDPAVGLLGLYAGYRSIGGDHFTRLAVEAHRYAGPWTIEAFAGWDNGQNADSFFGVALLSKYLHDDFRVTGGIGYSGWESGHYQGPGLVGIAGLEWQTGWFGPQAGHTIFAEGRLGDDYGDILAGFKWYFGTEPKSLIRRHREDDPPQTNGITGVDGRTVEAGDETPST